MDIDSALTKSPRKWPLTKIETLLNYLYSLIFSKFLMKNKKPEKIKIPH